MKKPLTIEEQKKKKLKKLQEKITDDVVNKADLGSDLDRNLVYFKGVFENVSDLIIKEFKIGREVRKKAALIYIGGTVDKKIINDNVLQELMVISRDRSIEVEPTSNQFRDLIQNSLLSVGEVNTNNKFDKLIDKLLNGNGLLLFDGSDQALTLGIQGGEKRSVTVPNTERVVRGPKEAFIESFKVNMTLIRKRIKTPDLKFESFKIGRVSKTDVVIGYLQGIVQDELIEEVKQRINRIDIDIISASGVVEQLIEDEPFSPFPQMNSTERPDAVAGALNEGRVVVIIDGSPYTLLLPAVFTHFIQSSEDYYHRFLFPTAIRLLRLLGFVIALLAPSIYIALTTFHQEMIPTPLLINIAASRAGVPFPSLIEALMMEISFEALREAGLRLPKTVGQAVSIVGALVVGEAAVQAGLVSQAMVIVVALTGIASFMIPAYNLGLAVRLLRFGIMFLAGSLGMFGITFAMLALLIHLSSLRSFGVPYLSPFAPLDLVGLKDAIFKAPEWFKNQRANFLVKEDQQRIKKNAKPKPPQEGEEDE
ncbi:spore germination protein, GerA family [Halobacteroides halobius DSM 5150]|uniref:Spore germination protein, GerA family n=1 Tax=Halobacteroides halobius (strain ATCC 35273 / DSM 5150 / MD-1) TaxID=748449 RepID=L0KDI7_HALHC|nr:spore germination protein [Halobacteroides halobius]AGB42434.1 spore germination protein, GerA family [Halobacteroides halobius DSM 5150]